MKDKVSFEAIGQVAATFYAAEGVKAGQVVKLSEDSTVAPCTAGEKFVGVAITDAKDGCAGVQTAGFAVVPCADGGVKAGYVSLAADGDGGVKKADGGAEYLVVAVNGDNTITIKM